MRVLSILTLSLLLSVSASLYAANWHVPGTVHSGPKFIAEGAVIIAEFEGHRPMTGWQVESAVDGYTGKGYSVYRGEAQPDGPTPFRFSFWFYVLEPGIYQLRLRSRSEGTENWCWASMDQYRVR
jgi:hypothetical protein